MVFEFLIFESTERKETLIRSAEVLNVVAAGTVCAVNHVNAEGNPAFFRGRIEKMKKDGSMVKVFLMDEGKLLVNYKTMLQKKREGENDIFVFCSILTRIRNACN